MIEQDTLFLDKNGKHNPFGTRKVYFRRNENDLPTEQTTFSLHDSVALPSANGSGDWVGNSAAPQSAILAWS